MSSLDASTPDDDPALRETLKRCSPATYYAACKFRKLGRADDLRLVVLGVIERFVERDLRAKLASGDATLRLSEDLGLDSLTLMEVVMLAEEVLRISVSNEELTQLRTVGQVHEFIAQKLATATAPNPSPADVRDDWDLTALSRDLRRAEAAAPAPPASA